MLILEPPREPIDDFERTLINAFSPLRTVHAVWIREVSVLGSHRYTRRVWLELSLWSPEDLRTAERLVEELKTRCISQPFYVEVEWVLGSPPRDIAPACIWRRMSVVSGSNMR